MPQFKVNLKNQNKKYFMLFDRKPYFEFKLFCKKHEQKSDQKRACDIDKKGRKRERFKVILQRRNVDQIARHCAARAADRDG